MSKDMIKLGRQLAIFVAVFSVLSMAFISPMMGDYSVTQEVRGAQVFEDCDPSDSLVVAVYNGLAKYSESVENSECRMNNDLRLSDETADAQGVYTDMANVADYKVNSERLTNSLIQSNADAVRNDAEVKFVQAYMDGKTLSESVAVNHDYINSEYTQRGDSLVSKYNRDLMTGESAYNELSTYDSTQYYNVYVDGEMVNAGDGTSTIEFDIGPVQDQHLTQNEIDSGLSFSQSTGVTQTHADGSTSVVGTITVDGTSYSYKDNLSVTLTNPSDTSSEVVVVGQDNLQKVDAGADSYTPSVSRSNADVVMASDGSGDYTSLGTAIDNTPAGGSLYVASGDYSAFNYKGLSKAITIVGEGADTTTINFASGASNNIGTGSNTVTIEGVKLVGNGSNVIDVRNGGTLHVNDSIIVADESNVAINIVTGTANASESILIGGTSGTLSTSTNVYTSWYSSYAQETISEQETARSDMISNMGDSSGGYLNDLWSEFESGATLPTDVLTYEQMYQNGFTSEEGYDSLYWYDAQYQQAGIAGHDLQYTIKVEVPAGSTVYANANKTTSTTLDSSKTYTGHLWTDHRPSGGSWESGTTYNTENLGGKVFVNYMGQEQYTDSSGNVVIESTSKTVAIEGEFTVTELKDSDGNTVQTVQHNDDPSADPYNATTFVEDFNESTNQKQAIQEGGSKASSGDGSGAGAGGSTCGIEVFGICSGITSFQFSLVGGFFALVVLGYLFRPLMEMLAGLTE